MDQAAFEAMLALGLGFAFAGVVASGFEAAASRPLRLAVLERGDFGSLACVPVILFSAPLLIVRNLLAGRRSGVAHVPFVMLATVIACFWSLLSGRVVFDLALKLLTA